MTEIAESVAVALPPAQETEESHDELEIEITEILDGEGNSIMNGASDYDPRQNAVIENTLSKIKYDIRNQATLVFITIEATSEPARGYYRNSSVRFFIELADPGSFIIDWDGRGMFDRRFVIEGDYTVKVNGLCSVCGTEVEATKTFHVRKPYAHCFGGNYVGVPTPGGGAHGGDSGSEAEAARSRLVQLSDNSGFDATRLYNTETAAAALVKMHEESGVWYWCGHGGPGFVSLPIPTGWTALISDPALASNYSQVVAPGNFADIDGLPDDALEDVFMVVLCGCQTAKAPTVGLATPQALVAKGVDIAIGFNLSIPRNSSTTWTQNFFDNLNDGNNVGDAVQRAIRSEPNPQSRTALSSCRIVTGPGASQRTTLVPARYGKKNS